MISRFLVGCSAFKSCRIQDLIITAAKRAFKILSKWILSPWLKIDRQKADTDFRTASPVWTAECYLFIYLFLLSLAENTAFSHITQNRELKSDTKWFALRKLMWNWDCECNRIFDSHSSTLFPDKSNDGFYSSLELGLTCPSESDRSQECQHRTVPVLSTGISIATTITALLACIQKS